MHHKGDNLAFKAIFNSQLYVPISDEPELEFSGSSRAELGRFRAKASWGTLIFELKLSWTEIF